MIILKDLELRDTKEYETYYVGVLDVHIVVTKDKNLPFDDVGKIRVYHDGLYFGTIEEMDRWIRNEIIEHIIATGNLVEVGETDFGDKVWKLQG